MLCLYTFVCLVVAIFIFLSIHTHSDSAGITFIELMISLPWAYMLVIYSIIGFILTGCEEFINHIKKKKTMKKKTYRYFVTYYSRSMGDVRFEHLVMLYDKPLNTQMMIERAEKDIKNVTSDDTVKIVFFKRIKEN